MIVKFKIKYTNQGSYLLERHFKYILHSEKSCRQKSSGVNEKKFKSENCDIKKTSFARA